MEGVNKDLVFIATLALENCNFDMRIPWMGGLRTDEDQNKIFERGFSRCDGYDKKSYHQSGNAIDIIPVNLYDDIEAESAFHEFSILMKQYWFDYKRKGELEWGGDWSSFIDKPHWQVKY